MGHGSLGQWVPFWMGHMGHGSVPDSVHVDAPSTSQ